MHIWNVWWGNLWNDCGSYSIHYTYMYLYIFRPDMRGSGDSTGFYYDEYDYQEQKDACELIGNVM